MRVAQVLLRMCSFSSFFDGLWIKFSCILLQLLVMHIYCILTVLGGTIYEIVFISGEFQ